MCSEITPWIPTNSVCCKDGTALTGPLDMGTRTVNRATYKYSLSIQTKLQAQWFQNCMPSQEGYFINHQLFHPVSLVDIKVSHLSNKYRYRSVKIQISMREYWRYIWSPPWTLVVFWILSVPIILLCWRCCHMMVLWQVGRNIKGELVGRGEVAECYVLEEAIGAQRSSSVASLPCSYTYHTFLFKVHCLIDAQRQ